jgi:hypothetical protein
MEEIILRVMKTTKVRSNIFFISKADPNLDPNLKLMTKSNPNLIWDTEKNFHFTKLSQNTL